MVDEDTKRNVTWERVGINFKRTVIVDTPIRDHENNEIMGQAQQTEVWDLIPVNAMAYRDILFKQQKEFEQKLADLDKQWDAVKDKDLDSLKKCLEDLAQPLKDISVITNLIAPINNFIQDKEDKGHKGEVVQKCKKLASLLRPFVENMQQMGQLKQAVMKRFDIKSNRDFFLKQKKDLEDDLKGLLPLLDDKEV